MEMEVREYSQGDEAQILKLFKLVFQREMSNSYWRWRYLDNPYGRGIIRLMFDRELLVGHYAVVPMPLMVAGKKIRAALSMTTMTHPDYGKRGIFVELASEAYSECEKTGIGIVLGFANTNSYHGLTDRLGWLGFGQVEYYENTELRNVSKGNRSGYKCETAEAFGDDIDKLWEKLKDRYSVIVPRDSIYLNWRYIDNPEDKYTILYVRDRDNQIQGYAVLKIYGSERGPIGHIVDILVADNMEAIESLVGASCGYFRDSNAETSAAWSYLSMPVKDVLKQLGFVKKKWVGFDLGEWPTYLGVKLIGAGGEQQVSAKKLENWYITMGDSDVF